MASRAQQSVQSVQRGFKVAVAVHSGRLEGGNPSPQFLADAAQYVAGLLDADEVVKRTRERYGLA